MAKGDRQAVELKVEFVRLPPELEPAWRAGLLLLLDILKGEKCDVASSESLPMFIEQACEV